MSEAQLHELAEAMSDREEDAESWPDPREFHKDWAKQNCIPPWVEEKLWERKKNG